MGCCDLKQCAGKWGVLLFTAVFGLGVVISTLSPNWIAFKAENSPAGDGRFGGDGITEVELGPFYGSYRTCARAGGDDVDESTCTSWESRPLELSDCLVVGEVGPSRGKLCRQLATFRSCGILCLLLTLVGGGLVLAASCCQMATCGCCGNSLTCVSNVLFSAEVLLSVVAWAFAVSSLGLIEDGPGVTETAYQWALWLFLACGTVVGALAAWMADWAAEDSCLRGIWHCMTCCFRGDDDDSDKREPLVGA